MAGGREPRWMAMKRLKLDPTEEQKQIAEQKFKTLQKLIKKELINTSNDLTMAAQAILNWRPTADPALWAVNQSMRIRVLRDFVWVWSDLRRTLMGVRAVTTGTYTTSRFDAALVVNEDLAGMSAEVAADLQELYH